MFLDKAWALSLSVASFHRHSEVSPSGFYWVFIMAFFAGLTVDLSLLLLGLIPGPLCRAGWLFTATAFWLFMGTRPVEILPVDARPKLLFL